MLANLCVILALVILVFFTVRLTYNIDVPQLSHSLERFDLPSAGTVPAGSLNADVMSQYVTIPRLSLMLTPVISGMNTVIDAVNELPKTLYARSVGASKKIKLKLQEYAETMTGYNRSADDSEGLKNLTINKKHKLFIDSLPSTTYVYITKVADTFYGAPFENQEALVRVVLQQLSLSNDNLAKVLITQQKGTYSTV